MYVEEGLNKFLGFVSDHRKLGKSEIFVNSLSK